jgi:hypothetical protein
MSRNIQNKGAAMKVKKGYTNRVRARGPKRAKKWSGRSY